MTFSDCAGEESKRREQAAVSLGCNNIPVWMNFSNACLLCRKAAIHTGDVHTGDVHMADVKIGREEGKAVLENEPASGPGRRTFWTKTP